MQHLHGPKISYRLLSYSVNWWRVKDHAHSCTIANHIPIHCHNSPLINMSTQHQNNQHPAHNKDNAPLQSSPRPGRLLNPRKSLDKPLVQLGLFGMQAKLPSPHRIKVHQPVQEESGSQSQISHKETYQEPKNAWCISQTMLCCLHW